jgi:hypothetical protein
LGSYKTSNTAESTLPLEQHLLQHLCDHAGLHPQSPQKTRIVFVTREGIQDGSPRWRHFNCPASTLIFYVSVIDCPASSIASNQTRHRSSNIFNEQFSGSGEAGSTTIALEEGLTEVSTSLTPWDHTVNAGQKEDFSHPAIEGTGTGGRFQ